MKQKIIEALILTLPDFEVNCDAFGLGIEGVLNQDEKLIVFFSEKLSNSKRNYSIYDL